MDDLVINMTISQTPIGALVSITSNQPAPIDETATLVAMGVHAALTDLGVQDQPLMSREDAASNAAEFMRYVADHMDPKS